MMPVDTCLPPLGAGYTTYNREGGGADQYGSASTILAILVVAAAWGRSNPGQPFAVGDISYQGGGPFPGHASHRFGVDADLRPLRKDGRNLPVTHASPEYSRERTRELIRAIRAGADVRVILFNDPQLIREGLCVKFAGHDNHLHVSFGDRQPKAVRTFQLEHGLAADGLLGPRTLARLAEVLEGLCVTSGAV